MSCFTRSAAPAGGDEQGWAVLGHVLRVASLDVGGVSGLGTVPALQQPCRPVKVIAVHNNTVDTLNNAQQNEFMRFFCIGSITSLCATSGLSATPCQTHGVAPRLHARASLWAHRVELQPLHAVAPCRAQLGAQLGFATIRHAVSNKALLKYVAAHHSLRMKGLFRTAFYRLRWLRQRGRVRHCLARTAEIVWP